MHLVTSPMYHLSPLNFGYFSLHLEHTVVLMERVGRRARAAADRALPRHRRRDGADAAAPADGSCPKTCAREYDVSSLRQVIHAAAPCPIELKRRLFDVARAR